MLRRRLARVRVTYFDIYGLGEPIRLALALADMPFTDERLTREQFAEVKPQLRFGQVPCLTVNGDEYFQTSAILRYIGRAFDTSGSLYPLDNLAVAATVDALLDACTDMVMGKRVFSYRERYGFPESLFTPAVLESIQAKWTSETLPRHLGNFLRCLADSPTGWLAGTRGPSVADVLLASMLRNEITPLAPLPPPLAELVKRVYSLPAVVAFKQAEAAAKETKRPAAA
jgi:glutathione S-transferase